MSNSYFQSYQDYFWQWEESAEVVAIPDGRTIAYKKIIADFIEMAASQGLPPFGSLLLTFLATNANGKKDIDQIFQWVENSTFSINKSEIKKSIAFLKRLSDLPNLYKIGTHKLLLLKALFEDCHYITSIQVSKSISKNYRNSSQVNWSRKVASKQAVFHREFRVIALLSDKFKDNQSIIDKITNLPELEEELLLEDEISMESIGLIDELILTPKTHKVGALVKNIWSGLNLPFHSSIPSQQPIGGVSDLTNKGNLDQLLISEYTNEEIVFLSRLANNEALYLSRESPPESNDLKRVILIDISLKSWGTPKIIAFATMLAIAKHPKTKIECAVFLIGINIHQIKIDTVDDLVNALQIIEAPLNAAQALNHYFKAYPQEKNKEVFFLSERSALESHEIHKVINEFGQEINYFIFNDADGKINIYKNFKKSKKHIQHLALPLNQLWSTNKKRKLIPIETNHDLDYYPILVIHSQNHHGFRSTENGQVFQFTKQNSLLKLHSKPNQLRKKAWELIYENLPSGQTHFEIGVLKNGTYIMLLFNEVNKEVVLVNLNTKETKKSVLPHWENSVDQNFIFKEEYFLCLNGRRYWKIDLNGTITENDSDHISAFAEREKQTKDVLRKYAHINGVFKNMKEVVINGEGNLMLSIHQLILKPGNHIKLDVAKTTLAKTKMISASKINEDYFEFMDGSTVEMNRSGLIILKSSDLTIPIIYVPSVLNATLGITTCFEFSGNDFFYKEAFFDIELKSHGGDKLSVIKKIKELRNTGLNEASEFIATLPRKLLQFYTEREAEEIKDELVLYGAEVEIQAHTPTHKIALKIPPNVFFIKYINRFIHIIQAHGTSN